MIIDKTPLNLLHIGLARALFPDCRIICMSRHPLDVGISNFCAAFGEAFISANPFLKSLEHIGHFAGLALKSTLDYRQKLGDGLRLQSYRGLVENMEAQARALVAHSGLDWHEACLQPEKRKGKVATASLLQVRAPVHTDRLDRWKIYGDGIQPLVDGFGGWSKISEWEELDQSLYAIA